MLGSNWLTRPTPDLNEAREALKCIVNDGHLAGEVIGGIRSMFKKSGHEGAPQDLNEVIREVLALLRGEIQNQQVSIRSELAEELPQVPANRVQLQQVIVNLIMNAVDAMSTVVDRARILRVKTELYELGQILIEVGVRNGDRSREYQSRLRRVLHDQIAWHGDGAVDLPLDHRKSWWAPLGLPRSAPGIDLSHVVAHPWLLGAGR